MPIRRGSSRRLLSVLIVAIVGLLASTGCRRAGPAPDASATRPPGWPSELTIGFAGGIDTEAALEANKPLAARIEKATGIPVKFYTATAYSTVVQAMRNRRVDGMQTGVFSYLLAVQEADAEALALYVSTFANPAVYDPLIRAEYCSIISVKKGKGIASLADIKGRTFTFVEPASTSGHLVAKTELMKAGLVPDRDFKTRFSGSHAASMIALWNDQADAVATAELALRNMVVSGQIKYCGFPDNEIGRRRTKEEVQALYDSCPVGSLAPIHFSAPIPGTPIAFRKDLPADLKATIQAALLSTPGDPEFIRAAKRWYVDPSKELGLPSLDAYYNPLREVATMLDLDLKGLQ